MDDAALALAVRRFEQLCHVSSTPGTQQRAAQAELHSLADPNVAIVNAQVFCAVLKASTDTLALAFASNFLTKLVTDKFEDQAFQTHCLPLHELVYGFLQSPRVESLPRHVRLAATRLYCRVTHKGWFVDSRYRRALPKAQSLLEAAMRVPMAGSVGAGGGGVVTMANASAGAGAETMTAGYCRRRTALELLAELVTELGSPQGNTLLIPHRKLVVSLRTSLMHVFTSVVNELDELTAALSAACSSAAEVTKAGSGGAPPARECLELLTRTLNVMTCCLGFDFSGVGSFDDELLRTTSRVVALPIQWRSIVTPKLVEKLFQAYQVTVETGNIAAQAAPSFQLGPPGPAVTGAAETQRLATKAAAQSLEVVTLLAGVRRPVVADASSQLKVLLEGIYKVLFRLGCYGAPPTSVCHELCRLLARLKSTFKLQELTAAEGYEKWLALLSQFSVNSFTRWRWSESTNSTDYLLEFWAMVSGATCGAPESPAQRSVGEAARQVVRSYIEGRLAEVKSAYEGGGSRGGALTGLRGLVGRPGSHRHGSKSAEEREVLALDEQLAMLPLIGRFWYADVGQHLCQLIDVRANELSASAQRVGQGGALPTPGKLAVLQSELALLLRVVAAFLNAGLPTSNRRSRLLASVASFGGRRAKALGGLLVVSRGGKLAPGQMPGDPSPAEAEGKLSDVKLDAEMSRRALQLIPVLASLTRTGIGGGAAAIGRSSSGSLSPAGGRMPGGGSGGTDVARTRLELELALLRVLLAVKKQYFCEGRVPDPASEPANGGVGGAPGNVLGGGAVGSGALGAPPSPSTGGSTDMEMQTSAGPPRSGGAAASRAVTSSMSRGGSPAGLITHGGSTFLGAARRRATNEAEMLRSTFDEYVRHLGLGSTTQVLALIVGKMLSNLRAPGNGQGALANVDAEPDDDPGRPRTVIHGTLKLLSSMVTDLPVGRMMLRLPDVQTLITVGLRGGTDAPHQFQMESILTLLKQALADGAAAAGGAPGAPKFTALTRRRLKESGRHRRTLYLSLARLIWLQDGPALFRAFATPFTRLLVQVANLKDLQSSANLEVASAVMGACYDIRGVAQGSFNKRTYAMLFEVLLDDGRALEPIAKVASELRHWGPCLTIPLLHLLIELTVDKRAATMGRESKIDFVSRHSAGGVRLFRCCGQVAAALIPHFIAVQIATDGDVWGKKLKGLHLCLSMLNNCLSARWINLGLFELYGDKILEQVLDVSLKLAVSLPVEQTLEFTKLATTFFEHLALLFQNHMDRLIKLESLHFLKLLEALKRGLSALTPAVSTACGRGVDSFASFLFRNSQAGTDSRNAETARRLRMHVSARPMLLKEMLWLLFQIILFTECTNSWSLSCPVFALILAAPAAFEACKKELVRSQPVEVRPQLQVTFKMLMHSDIRPNLEAYNYKLFAKQLQMFRRAATKILVV